MNIQPFNSDNVIDENQLYTSVFRFHFDTLYNYGKKITNDNELVKDCIQELFFRIWKNKVDLTSISYIKSYLLKGLRRQILNVLELKYNHVDKIELEDNFLIEFSHEDYLIQMQNEDGLRTQIISALNQLSKKQREAIYLRYFEELEYSEIAEVMNINLQSVKNNVHRGLNALRDIISVSLLFWIIEKSTLLK
ncbi:MAG: RNA polymerase sigma factor [Bacteroidetes bacterium]|nr:RNA polymerase sigma factor [Bacteroidota bacterium]